MTDSPTLPPEIVAVIPSYNRAATVGRAVRSVLEQTRPAEEVLVVDDGSTDDTPEVLADFGDTIRVLRTENAGAAVARNRGVAATAAGWIAFLDSDDLWLPDHLARIAAAITATEGRARVYFDDTVRPADGGGEASLFALADLRLDGAHEIVDDATGWVLRPRQPSMLQSSVFARSAWEDVGGLWPVLRSRHDTHLFLRLGIGGSMCAVAGIGCRMTDDDTSGNRQMDAMGTRSRRYWEHTVHLYTDVIDRHGRQLADDQRTVLEARLARGHLALARQDLPRHPVAGTRHLVRALATHPPTAFGPVRRRLGGRP